MTNYKSVVEVLTLAEGRISGDAKLHKLFFLLEKAGWDYGFSFNNLNGPHSYDLESAVTVAEAYGLIRVKQVPIRWGGSYSVFDLAADTPPKTDTSHKGKFIRTVIHTSSMALVALTTAMYNQRSISKPLKDYFSMYTLDAATEVYEELKRIPTPKPLPELPTWPVY